MNWHGIQQNGKRNTQKHDSRTNWYWSEQKIPDEALIINYQYDKT